MQRPFLKSAVVAILIYMFFADANVNIYLETPTYSISIGYLLNMMLATSLYIKELRM
jgi:hypothetical protein